MLDKERTVGELNRLAFAIVIGGIIVFGILFSLIIGRFNADPKPPQTKVLPTMSAAPTPKKK